MTDDFRYRLPSEVATQLHVSPSTLRRWSNEFADFLSDSAGRPLPTEGSQTAHRRYSDEDLETLMTIKGLLAEGQTYMQVGKRLEALRLRKATDAGDFDPEIEDGPVRTLGPSRVDAPPFAPAVTVLADTLHTVADGQQLLLGSHQANRDMMTVLVQDNFNLKEENAKLRDRMLEVERNMAEMRRLDADRREAIEARLQSLEARLRQPPPAPAAAPKPSRSERPGCLGQLFG